MEMARRLGEGELELLFMRLVFLFCALEFLLISGALNCFGTVLDRAGLLLILSLKINYHYAYCKA